MIKLELRVQFSLNSNLHESFPSVSDKREREIDRQTENGVCVCGVVCVCCVFVCVCVVLCCGVCMRVCGVRACVRVVWCGVGVCVYLLCCVVFVCVVWWWWCVCVSE